jgi:hypothetical protein
MAFKFNPFTGNFDDVSDVANKIDKVASTDNAIVRYNGTAGDVQNSGVTIDDSNNVIIPGNLQVDGTTTSVNSTTLEVADANVTVNNGGNDASAEGSGLTIERTGTDGSLVYEDVLASKFKIGAVGSEVEIANISSAQTLTTKTIVVASNTITTAASGNLVATELNAALAELQSDIDSRAVIADVFNITSSSGVFTATADETHLVDTSGGVGTVTLPAVSANRFVRIKDSSGDSEVNNITVSPASGTIDGAATNVIDSNYGSVIYVSDGTNWFIL